MLVANHSKEWKEKKQTSYLVPYLMYHQHPDWPKLEKDFWASMTVKIPFEGKELDITVDEDGNPHNVMDYVTYKWCKKHRQVADTKEDMEKDQAKRFYIYDPQRETSQEKCKSQNPEGGRQRIHQSLI